MKKLFTISLVLVCATMINAQGNLYFTPTGWWNNPDDNGAVNFNVCLKTNATADAFIAQLLPVSGSPGVYSVYLASTNYMLIRFLRMPHNETLAGADDWGYNKTGYMAFNYAEGNHWVMTQECDNGANDKANFDIRTFGAQSEAVVLKIRKADSNTWNEIAVYSWSSEIPAENVQAFGNWPGTLLTAGADGWYVINVPESRPIRMILNNNGNGGQFDFINDPTVSACYMITNTAAVEENCPQAGIEDLFATPQEIIRIEYYNLLGMRLQAEPQEGLFIAVPYYKGNVRGEAVKVLNRR